MQSVNAKENQYRLHSLEMSVIFNARDICKDNGSKMKRKIIQLYAMKPMFSD